MLRFLLSILLLFRCCCCCCCKTTPTSFRRCAPPASGPTSDRTALCCLRGIWARDSIVFPFSKKNRFCRQSAKKRHAGRQRQRPRARSLSRHGVTAAAFFSFFLARSLDLSPNLIEPSVQQGHQRKGIDLQDFGELLMTSGLVLLPNVTWLSFHSGYDFGYLIKLLTCSNLPAQARVFRFGSALDSL